MNNDNLSLTEQKWTFHVPTDLFYSDNDVWISLDNAHAILGITDFLTQMVGDLIFVEPKPIDTHLTIMDEAASIESVKTMIDLISPVAGRITKINPDIISNPEIINTDPYKRGWILEIEIDDLDANKEFFMSPLEYFDSMKKKVQKEKDKLGKQ